MASAVQELLDWLHPIRTSEPSSSCPVCMSRGPSRRTCSRCSSTISTMTPRSRLEAMTYRSTPAPQSSGTKLQALCTGRWNSKMWWSAPMRSRPPSIRWWPTLVLHWTWFPMKTSRTSLISSSLTTNARWWETLWLSAIVQKSSTRASPISNSKLIGKTLWSRGISGSRRPETSASLNSCTDPTRTTGFWASTSSITTTPFSTTRRSRLASPSPSISVLPLPAPSSLGPPGRTIRQVSQVIC